MAQRVILSVGTKRGLFLLESTRGRARWKLTGPLLKGWTVPYAMIDTRGTPRVHAAASSLTYSTTTLSAPLSKLDFKPADAAPAFPKMNRAAAQFAKRYGLDMSNRIWIIHPGPPKQKKVLYLGTAPAGLFRSEDGGKTWDPVRGLNEHRSRKDWQPGAGGQCLHSIQIDPHDPARMYAAISAAGAFRSDDGGERWTSINSCVSSYVGAKSGTDVDT